MICPRCSYKNADGNLTCNLCGELLRRKAGGSAADAVERHDSLAKTELSPVRRSGAEGSKVVGPAEDMEILLSEGGEAGDLRFWLYCFPLEPVELTRGRTCTVGRGTHNDLVLPVGAVSRTHARVSWNGRSFEIMDLDSLNGTYVNGRKADREAVKPGDMIGIGPYDIEVRAARGILENLKAMLDTGESTKIFAKDDLPGPDPTLSGKVGEVRLGEVFQLVEFNRKTGTLRVLSGERRGEFFFREGQILDAAMDDARGIAAVARAIRLDAGNFTFEAGEPSCEQTIHDPTVKVLLDASRFLDEGRGDPAP
jgi:hypothetical protein